MFGAFVFFLAEIEPYQPWTTCAFLIGGFNSIFAGYIGMKVAVYTNVRTTKECAESIHAGFIVAFRGGQVLGFTLVGLALLVLVIIIEVYWAWYLTPAIEEATANGETEFT